ncbi:MULTISPECIES: hypothetical protein [Cyanophyceae]|uniref:hypothetical protein n=1 Tax=Cyanophyceae TaxID=3028117 RepID=UPI001684DFE5|nr:MULTISPECIES: hypothetical protein [Cyanophyceae]MBD1917969.1 hypothetical protein [Phormidium sp. FACHB-77]MBD2029217.1 hypothetical protein [Phormidium sp. FACHB-322]
MVFKPVFVDPKSNVRIKGIDEHDKSIYIAFAISLLILIPILSPSFSFLIPLIFFGSTLFQPVRELTRPLLKGFAIVLKRHSIRPFHCIACKKPLAKSSAPVNSLTDKEQLASEIGSIDFEVWYCTICCSEPIQNSMHLRAYIDSSNDFRLCSSCDEVTMVKTSSRVLEKATAETEGQELFTYACQYCQAEKTEIKIIPRVSDGGGGGG